MIPIKLTRKKFIHERKREKLEYKDRQPKEKVDRIRGTTSPDEAMKVIKQAIEPLWPPVYLRASYRGEQTTLYQFLAFLFPQTKLCKI